MNSYLLLLTAVLVISLITNFVSNAMSLWKAILPAVFGTGVIFITSSLLLKGLKLVSYNLEAFVGGDSSGIPYEIIATAFIFPFAGISFYNFLNNRYPEQTYEKYSLALSNILMGLCIAMIFFAYSKWYPVFTFALMIIILFLVEYKNKIRFMYRFYRAYLAALVAYLLVTVPFHYANHIRYNEVHTVKFKLIYVPFENYFYIFSMVLISIWLFEVFKKKYKLA